MTAKTSILFLIPSLVAHGAERQLCELARHLDPARFEVHVVVFYGPSQCDGGDLTPDLADLPHVTLHHLEKRRGPAGYLVALPRLLRLALRINPDILHGYMDGNLPVLLVGSLLHKRRVWGIRATQINLVKAGGLGLHLMKLAMWLAKYVDLVIFNSEAGLAHHRALGLRAPHVMVIPNGFDTRRFHPDAQAGARQRAIWGLPPETPVLGIVGRLDPVKDHPTFLRTAARVSRERPDTRFVCVGAGPGYYRQSLQDQALALGLGDKVLWPGNCEDMPAAYNALTLLILSSTDEGFPNAIGEAMACGIPCVATRAGDAAELIGQTGLVAAVGDDQELSRGALALLAEPAPERAARSRAAVARIGTTFGTDALALRTGTALQNLLQSRRASAGGGK